MKTILKFFGMVILCCLIGSSFGYIGADLFYEHNDTANTENIDIKTTKTPVVLPSEDEVFAKFTADYWKNISISEIQAICEELSILIRSDLQLENYIETVFVYDSDLRRSGCHYRNQNRVEINLYQIYHDDKPYLYIVNVLAHENRHAYQEQRVKQGFNTKLEDSYNNYITPEVSYTGYYNQLCEVDARNYGSYWEKLLQKWLVA